MDDAVSTAIMTKFSGSALATALAGKLARSRANTAWGYPYGVFQGVNRETVQRKDRSTFGIDACTVRFAFFAVAGPDADRLAELAMALFNGVRLTLSDETKIKLLRSDFIQAAKDQDAPDQESAPFMAWIDFQYFRTIL